MIGFDDPHDLSYDLEDDGREVRRQLDARVWVRGGWATGIYHFEELDRATDTWRAPRAAVIRFRKVRGGWRLHATINLAPAIVHALGATLAAWFPPDAPDDPDFDPSADDGDD